MAGSEDSCRAQNIGETWLESKTFILYYKHSLSLSVLFKNVHVQYNLDLVTLNLATTCDLVTILQRPFFNLLHKIIPFSDIMRFSDSF